MSVIAHRCNNCGHPDFWQTGAPRRCPGKQWGLGCCTRCAPGQPEVVPTYGLDGQPVERIITPGEPITAGVASCGCDDCQALYAGLTAA